MPRHDGKDLRQDRQRATSPMTRGVSGDGGYMWIMTVCNDRHEKCGDILLSSRDNVFTMSLRISGE